MGDHKLNTWESPLREMGDAWSNSHDRFEMWAAFLTEVEPHAAAEIGVYRGAFASAILNRCPTIERYYMIDPWRHLDRWNKPLNVADAELEGSYRDALAATAAYGERRIVLRGTTAETIGQIPDGGLDFAYIDADHTLRGITIDLARVWPKIREGGWIGGDDFDPSPWRHGSGFEPTLVFPYAVYFAEAMDAPISAAPHGQFLIEKKHGFAFRDSTCSSLELRGRMAQPLRDRMAMFAARAARKSWWHVRSPKHDHFTKPS